MAERDPRRGAGSARRPGPHPDRQMLLLGSSIQTQNLRPTAECKINGYDFHIVKLDQQGNKLWDRYYGGNRHDYLVSSVATQEGGFLLAGTSYSGQGPNKKEHSLGGSDLWILKLDENGEEQWQKTLGTSRNDQASTAVQSADLGFFVAGNTAGLSQEFGTTDTFVVKLDKAGNVTAQILLGGSGRNELQKMIPHQGWRGLTWPVFHFRYRETRPGTTCCISARYRGKTAARVLC